MNSHQLSDGSIAVIRPFVAATGRTRIDRYVISAPDAAGHSYRRWTGSATVADGSAGTTVYFVAGSFPEAAFDEALTFFKQQSTDAI